MARCGYLLHCEMTFTVSRAASLGGTHTRRIERIDEIHIHCHVKTSGIQRCDFYGFEDYVRQTALIQFAHREHANAERLEQLALAGVDASSTDNRSVFRQYFGRKSGN